MMKIAVGSDHGGFNYKNKIKEYLASRGIEIVDAGTYTAESCDYPEIAHKVAKMVAAGEVERGILICGTGIGMSIAANKTAGIRAALCSDTFSAKATREHNDSNILCLGERVLGEGLMLDIVQIWLDTPFSQGERHKKRISMIEK
ncbi:MAG: ribose 5-phosphate isomerase B [Fusobacterium sp.]|nr:ribose 5-phosphate isomerase B [Fusobacterium sp.]